MAGCRKSSPPFAFGCEATKEATLRDGRTLTLWGVRGGGPGGGGSQGKSRKGGEGLGGCMFAFAQWEAAHPKDNFVKGR